MGMGGWGDKALPEWLEPQGTGTVLAQVWTLILGAMKRDLAR